MGGPARKSWRLTGWDKVLWSESRNFSVVVCDWCGGIGEKIDEDYSMIILSALRCCSKRRVDTTSTGSHHYTRPGEYRTVFT
jgi:hypothetical protein